MKHPYFTIFIPTYNRGYLLPRALESIERQSFRDFEVVIVDDGSTDDTETLVKAWQARVSFPVNYVKQSNQGKHVAYNTGVAAARGELLVNLDSDDRLLPHTLERVFEHWHAIPEARREHFAGIQGLVQSMDGQRLLSNPYPQSPLDANYIEVFLKVGGEKKHAFRVDILRQFPYPVFPGERHVRPDVTWKRFAHKYLLRHVNEVLQQVEFLPGGLSSDRFRLRINNPRGFQLFCLEDMTLHRKWLDRKTLVRRTIDFIRFSLHSGQGVAAQAKLTKGDPLWLLLLPLGFVRWLNDLYRLKVKGGSHSNRKATRN